jgi:hypothetical protein
MMIMMLEILRIFHVKENFMNTTIEQRMKQNNLNSLSCKKTHILSIKWFFFPENQQEIEIDHIKIPMQNGNMIYTMIMNQPLIIQIIEVKDLDEGVVVSSSLYFPYKTLYSLLFLQSWWWRWRRW